MLNAYHNFESLNCGIYHDTTHAILVSKISGKMAKNAGFGRKHCRFLAQVALLHDADERRHPETGEKDPLLPPRVSNTLDWMDRNEDYLCRHFSWTKSNFVLAQAIIARTIYPYDTKPRNVGQRFHGMTPLQISERLHHDLEPELRETAVSLGLILRYADQISNYSGPWRRLERCLKGIREELKAEGAELKGEELGTLEFLQAVGSDLTQDKALVLKFGLNRDCLYGQEVLHSFLPKDVKKRLQSNLRGLAKDLAA